MKKTLILLTASIAILASCAAPATLVTLNRKTIDSVRRHKDAPQYARAYAQLIKEAEANLKAEPLAIVNQGITPPSGDKHDYMSMGPYWWPDPAKPDGLPYIRRDGEHNPEIKKMEGRTWLGLTCSRVDNLARAWYFSGEEKYAEKAVEFIKVWFLDPETRMNPNLTYGQSIPGRCTGRGIGLIDTRRLGQMMDSLIMLEGSKAWTPKVKAAMQDWIRTFYRWMLDSEIGKEEGRQPNNHATAYDFQICAYAIFCGDLDVARGQLENVAKARMDVQFPADASQPLELKRTNSWGYSTGNLNIWMELVNIGENLGTDLWSWRNSKGVGLQQVVEWYFPHLLEGKPWFKKDISPIRGATSITRVMMVYCRKFCPEKFPELLEGIKAFTDGGNGHDFEGSPFNLLYPVKD